MANSRSASARMHTAPRAMLSRVSFIGSARSPFSDDGVIQEGEDPRVELLDVPVECFGQVAERRLAAGGYRNRLQPVLLRYRRAEVDGGLREAARDDQVLQGL